VENLLNVRREKLYMDPVHASFTMSNMGVDSSLEHLQITTHFTSLPTTSNNNHKK
jgi:hypothetical protein